jgi:hypothetical protein
MISRIASVSTPHNPMPRYGSVRLENYQRHHVEVEVVAKGLHVIPPFPRRGDTAAPVVVPRGLEAPRGIKHGAATQTLLPHKEISTVKYQ